jgi:Family of unknown function (DUF6459)
VGTASRTLSTDWPLGGYAARTASVTLVSRSDVSLSLSTDRTRRFESSVSLPVEAHVSTTVALPGSYTVHWLIESRPPSVSWSRPGPPQPNQPPLDLFAQESHAAEVVRPRDGGARITTVKARWAARPRPGLPDAQQWSAALALAVVQALLGHRAVAQLNRWVADEVLIAISMYQRRNLALHGRIAIPAAVRSVRVQHPDPGVTEVAAHVVIGKRSAALAFRLEAFGNRWLCTALELGARWTRVVGSS